MTTGRLRKHPKGTVNLPGTSDPIRDEGVSLHESLHSIGREGGGGAQGAQTYGLM